MATTAANSIHRHSLDPSMPRSRPDSSPWIPDAIHHHDHAPFDNDNAAADKKSVWNMPSSSSAEVRPIMGAASWPALSLSSSTNKSPSIPHDDGTTLSSTPDVNAGSSAAATTTSFENHRVNGERKPFKRNNIASSSSTSNISNQRGGSGAATQFRNSNRNYRNTNSYPRNDGHRRNNDHGYQSGVSHRNYNARDMQRGFGMMRPQMQMGPPSFHMVAPQLGSYGGPLLYPEYAAPHFLMPHPPSEPMALVGTFAQPIPMYFPSFDDLLYDRILTQVRFYFSADNLSQDKHLREQMNDQGWVPVRVIAKFKRLAEMTNNIHTILDALRSSKVVEIQGEAIRRRGDWDKYVFPREHSSYHPTAASSSSALPAGASSNASVESQLETMALTESRE